MDEHEFTMSDIKPKRKRGRPRKKLLTEIETSVNGDVVSKRENRHESTTATTTSIYPYRFIVYPKESLVFSEYVYGKLKNMVDRVKGWFKNG